MGIEGSMPPALITKVTGYQLKNSFEDHNRGHVDNQTAERDLPEVTSVSYLKRCNDNRISPEQARPKCARK
jgi:hypothetical protein